MKRLPSVIGLVLLGIDFASNSAMAFRSRYYTDCSENDDAHETSTARLQKRLICDPPYDAYVTHPHADSHKPTIVQLKVYPQSIEFDDLTLLLTIQTWLSMSWEDPHLTWTKDQFPDLTSISMGAFDIWTPSLSVFKTGGVDHSQSIILSPNCVVTMNGTVTCVPATELMTRCAPAFQHWPFDRQNCTIRFGSWGYNKDNVEYQFTEDETEMSDYTENLEWKILSVTTTQKLHKFKGSEKADSLLFLNIVLERGSASLEVAVVVPAITLIIMSLTVLWLDPMSVERMVLAGLNVISHLLCIMDLNWLIPSNGASVSSILIFHRNSLIMAGVAFFLTTFLRQLKKISIPAPDWLTSTTSVILSSRAGQFILLATLDPKASATLEASGGDNADLVQSNSFHPKENLENLGAWYHLATLLDRLTFAAVLFTYAITLLVLIPKNDL